MGNGYDVQPKTDSSKILNQEKCRPVLVFFPEAVVMDYHYGRPRHLTKVPYLP